jgi:hypothetical protein
VPAIGWILSASDIKLAAPAIINETTQIVIITAKMMIILLALEFRAAAAVFNVCGYCALSAAGFNRKVKNWFRTENAEHNSGFAPRGITRETVLCKGPGAYL